MLGASNQISHSILRGRLRCSLSAKSKNRSLLQSEKQRHRREPSSAAAIAMESMKGTKSQEEQWMVQNHVFRIYEIVYRLPPHAQSVHFELRRDNHIEYLTKSLKHLGPNFSALDANRPWLCYWIIHSIALLGVCLDDELENDFIDFLSRCQDQSGGYGGGPGQMPHLATTYAAVNALITVGGHKSLSSINREKMYAFLLQMKDASGGFRMHDGGEVDVRACYTAISVASVLNILDDRLIQTLEITSQVARLMKVELLVSLAQKPMVGKYRFQYTFCGLAAMVLINEVDRLDLPGLMNWMVFRQGIECGFQGRTNKLVDGCYSFWQGGAAAIIQRLHLMVNKQLGLPNTFKFDCSSDSGNDSSNSDGEQVSEGSCSPVNDTCQPVQEGKLNTTTNTVGANNGYNFIKGPIGMRPLFNSMALQQYILLCSQEEAGFRDKPGKRRDHYHTCYVLSGLSICQHSNTKDADTPPLPTDVMGPYSNLLEPVHPLYNIVLDKYYEAYKFFARG